MQFGYVPGSSQTDSLSGGFVIRITSSATIVATRELAGVANVRVTSEAVLNKEKLLTGNAAVAVSTSANIDKTKELSGAASITLTAAGSISLLRSVGYDPTFSVSRQITISTDDPVASFGETGDIWFKVT